MLKLSTDEQLTNYETGVTKEVLVSARHLLRPGLLVGAALTVAGITLMVSEAFKGGAEGYNVAEHQLFTELRLWDWDSFEWDGRSFTKWIFKK